MIENITAAIHADLPLFVWGGPGIGKSAIVRQAAELKGWTEASRQFIDVRLSQMEPVDLRGLPVPDMKIGTTTWLPPTWLPFEGSSWPDEGVLFLDEASSASPSVQAAAYQLVLDRQLGEARLKKGWRLILAGNRVTDGGVAFRLAMPLANRMLHVQAEADHDKWIDWGLTENKETGKPNIQEDVIKFLLFRPALLTNFELALKSKDMAFATPRSWEMVSIILTTQADAKPDVITTLIAAAVGPGPAAEFAAYRKLHKSLPDIDAVLQGRGAAVKCADKADVRHVATLALAFRVFETGETDITQAQEWSQRCVSWLDDLDVKWAALFINVVLRKKRRNGQLANIYLIGEKLQAWMEKHTDLITFRES